MRIGALVALVSAVPAALLWRRRSPERALS